MGATTGFLCVPILAYFLFMLTKWSAAKAKWSLFIGLGAMLLVLVAQLFVVGQPDTRALWIVRNVLEVVGAIFGLAAAVLSAIMQSYVPQPRYQQQWQQMPQQPAQGQQPPTV